MADNNLAVVTFINFDSSHYSCFEQFKTQKYHRYECAVCAVTLNSVYLWTINICSGLLLNTLEVQAICSPKSSC